MLRMSLPAFVVALAAWPAAGQGFPPVEAVKRMQLSPGFSARLIASEPTIRQPLSISFDDRGRLWVLQYLQYPNPAGLKPVKQDQYLRTVWDRVPEPPPRGPRGADRLTILSDPDERGVYRKSKDFVTGLNLASGFCLGHGGAFIVQPPYLLFYPDRNEDDVPDTDTPDVLLSGFGMEDSHSYANSLQWGPDGWLYGAHGSTVTAKIRNPARPNDPVVEFQQGIWRYHPKSKRFELFSEGGGNTYGLDFDKHGQAIAGTNWGGYAMLHQFQGAYYVKGFAKHGPLHNEHAYGYFQHVPYKNFKGGHVTCGGIVYQGDAYPTEMQDQYIAGNLLSNAVYWHRLTPSGPTFTAAHGGDLLVSNDTWFRPVDLILGPDGAVYIADWYDRRAAHLDPVDNWDKTNGRVYRIEFDGGKPFPSIDLRKKPTRELVELLGHPNAWWRREARRLLDERDDPAAYPVLRQQIAESDGLLALESLWTLYVSGGWDEDFARRIGLRHRFERVREWSVRLLGDESEVEAATGDALVSLADSERSPAVRAQLACTARRLPAPIGLAVVGKLLSHAAVEPDPVLPLLTWWAVESKMTADAATVHRMLTAHSATWENSLGRPLIERVARRYAAFDPPDWNRLEELLRLGKSPEQAERILAGVEQALHDRPTTTAPERFRETLRGLPDSPQVKSAGRRVRVLLGDPAEREAVMKSIAAWTGSDSERIEAIRLLTRVRAAGLQPALVDLLPRAKSDAVRLAVLDALESIGGPGTDILVLAGYPDWSANVKRRAVSLLTARPAWAVALMKAVDRGTIPKTGVTLEQARAVAGHGIEEATALVEKHFGRIGPATPGEKQARIAWLSIALDRGKGDRTAGKALYTQHCAKCHTLFGEGNKVGPDLTTADRKNRQYMLSNIVDPGAVIRPEYASHSAELADGRKLIGVVVESSTQSITLLDAENRQTTVARGDLVDLKPLPTSLMPDKLLDVLTDQQVCDLFAYLSSDPPAPRPPGK